MICGASGTGTRESVQQLMRNDTVVAVNLLLWYRLLVLPAIAQLLLEEALFHVCSDMHFWEIAEVRPNLGPLKWRS